MTNNSPFDNNHRVPIIGLVGGVASGKSVVAKMLSELGASIIDADQLGHEVLKDEFVRESLAAEFGSRILSQDKKVDRRELAQLVFGTDNESLEQRRKLETIVHPRIRELACAQIDAISASANPPKAIVLDAPLLIEAGWRPMCDHVLFVDTLDPSRLARGILRGWSEEEFRQRELAQMPIEDKRKHVTFVLDNNGSNAKLRQQVEEFWTLVGKPKR